MEKSLLTFINIGDFKMKFKTVRVIERLAVLSVLTICMTSCSMNQKPVLTTLSGKVLFVGDSFTGTNDGLENHVKKLAASATPPKLLQADGNTQAGATLKVQYGRPEIHDEIHKGYYDVFVLQDDIPELTEHSFEPFFVNAKLLIEEIRKAGSKPLLFMAWPYERLNWVSLEEIADAHRKISKELDVPVAPVGMAFHKAEEQRPSLNMLGDDKEHETIHGTYMAACVIYATLFGQNPQGLTYAPNGVSAEEAAFLQRVAWETVQEWNK